MFFLCYNRIAIKKIKESPFLTGLPPLFGTHGRGTGLCFFILHPKSF
nr:MAG TPA: hypothetical protein [Caudoviricetes sp.]